LKCACMSFEITGSAQSRCEMVKDHVRRALALLACFVSMTHHGGKALNSGASAAELSSTDESLSFENEASDDVGDAQVDLFFAAMQQATHEKEHDAATHEKEHDALEHKGKKGKKKAKEAASGKVTASRKTRSS
jgi:hypothetical protein